MKRVSFNTELGGHVTGIVANFKDDWQKLIPRCIRHCLQDLYTQCDGDLESLHGFFIGQWPIFAIVIFLDTEGADLLSTLSHESGHVQRHIIWGIGDQMTKKGDETYAKVQTNIYETFKAKLRAKYGMVETITWKPNARQRKNEIK